MNQPRTTCIRKAAWAVVFDPARGTHVYMRDADIAFTGDTIVHAGGLFTGPVDHIIDGAGLLVIPGLVNVHGHLGTEPLGKGFFEDLGNHAHHMSRLYTQIYVVRPPDTATRIAATQVAVAELLLSGCTTVTDMSLPYPGWVDTFAAIGVRSAVVPMFKSASWHVADGRTIEYRWDPAAGKRDMDAALDLLDGLPPGGLVSGMVMPAQADTCTPELLAAAHRAARDRALPLQIHSGQSVPEFHEMFRRHGTTAIAFLRDLGVLGPGTTISHAIFIDSHPWVRWHDQHDIEILAETGTCVAHCPGTFAYRGATLHDFGAYRRAGITMAMGTDTFPHNMADEMRLALFMAKTTRGHVDYTRTEDVFHAATIGGAAALGRDDIGRIGVGAKADIVLIDTAHPAMQPCRDPLRSFIFSAGDRAVTDVFVGGRQLVDTRRHTTIDLEAALAELTRGHALAMQGVTARDWAGRTAHEVSPLSLAMSTPCQTGGPDQHRVAKA